MTTRPTRPAWIEDEAVARTKEVWSRFLGRPVEDGEAVEMLVNVRRLAEVLIRAQRSGACHEAGDLGAGVVARAEGRVLD